MTPEEFADGFNKMMQAASASADREASDVLTRHVLALHPRMASMLRRLEWAGDIHGDAACPCCSARRDIDLPANPERGYAFEPAGVHRPGCDLATLLRDLP